MEEMTSGQRGYLERRYCALCGKQGACGGLSANGDRIRVSPEGLPRCTRYACAALDGWSA